MSYRLITTEEKEKIAPELIDNPDVDLFFDGDKYWIRKPRNPVGEERNRELLGYLLAKNFANCAEVKLPSSSEVEEIVNLVGTTTLNVDNLCLVRVCGSYNLRELPQQSVEAAVANELLYSLWVRRRDTHVDNRVYISSGLPLFYDHHVAFLGEDLNDADVSLFFASKSHHYHGSASWWRVVEKDKYLTTVEARNVKDIREKAYHYVSNLNIFNDELEKAKDNLQKLYSDRDIEIIVKESGLAQVSNNIAEFLMRNLHNLDKDTEKMLEVIFAAPIAH